MAFTAVKNYEPSWKLSNKMFPMDETLVQTMKHGTLKTSDGRSAWIPNSPMKRISRRFVLFPIIGFIARRIWSQFGLPFARSIYQLNGLYITSIAIKLGRKNPRFYKLAKKGHLAETAFNKINHQRYYSKSRFDSGMCATQVHTLHRLSFNTFWTAKRVFTKMLFHLSSHY